MTYPAADSLAEMAVGAKAIMDEVGVDQVNLVGSSLGGYFAQYLVANKQPAKTLLIKRKA